MKQEFTVTRFFNISNRDLYKYFVDSNLIEKWSYPNGMVLRVPQFEAKEGGKYRYEHSDERGTFVCEGHIEQMVSGQSLKMVDDWIMGPDGKMIDEKLSCDVVFMSLGNGCDLVVHQAGFKSEEFAHDCENGWIQCLDRLQALTQRSEIPPRDSIRDQGSLGMDPSI